MPGLPRAQLMHGLDHRDHVIDRSLGKDAVAQIKNMSRLSARALQNVFDAPAYFLGLGEQYGRIQISLDADPVSDRSPAFIQMDPPVEPDDVAAGGAY